MASTKQTIAFTPLAKTFYSKFDAINAIELHAIGRLSAREIAINLGAKIEQIIATNDVYNETYNKDNRLVDLLSKIAKLFLAIDKGPINGAFAMLKKRKNGFILMTFEENPAKAKAISNTSCDGIDLTWIVTALQQRLEHYLTIFCGDYEKQYRETDPLKWTSANVIITDSVYNVANKLFGEDRCDAIVHSAIVQFIDLCKIICGDFNKPDPIPLYKTLMTYKEEARIASAISQIAPLDDEDEIEYEDDVESTEDDVESTEDENEDDVESIEDEIEAEPSTPPRRHQAIRVPAAPARPHPQLQRRGPIMPVPFHESNGHMPPMMLVQTPYGPMYIPEPMPYQMGFRQPFHAGSQQPYPAPFLLHASL